MKSATKCFREMRSLTIDTPTNVEETLLLRTGRKLSQVGQTMDWEEPSSPLQQLGNYINSNIQSERKSIIELYSTSICLLQKADRLPSPILVPNKYPRKRLADHLECASPSRGCSEAGNDRDFMVSNNFPIKLIKKERNRLQAIIKEQLPIKPKKECSPTCPQANTPETPTRKLSPSKAVGGHISKLAIRRKLPKLRGERQKSTNELNPWEYLQVQDEPIFISCPRRQDCDYQDLKL